MEDNKVGHQLKVEELLFRESLEEWQKQKDCSYQGILAFRHPNALGAVRIISSLGANEWRILTTSLAKRTRSFLQRADPSFFTSSEKELVQDFLRKLGHLTVPLGDSESTTLLNEHWSRKKEKNSRKAAVAIRRKLMERLKESLCKLPGYVLSRPEPAVSDLSKVTPEYSLWTEWSFQTAWEFDHGTWAETSEHLRFAYNVSFLNLLGISSSIAWFADLREAEHTLDITIESSTKIRRIISSAFEGEIGFAMPMAGNS